MAKPSYSPADTAPLPGPNDWGPRAFEVVSDGHHYRLTLPSVGIALDLTHLRRNFGELTGDLSVACPLPGARTIDGVLYSATLKVGQAEQRYRMGKAMQMRANAKDIDFEGLLHELAMRVEKSLRAGGGFVDLAAVKATPGVDEWFDVYGIKLSRRHASMIFGMGDSLKSFIQTLILGELEQQGIRTLLCDWELADVDQADRLRQLYGTQAPHVRYYRAEQSFVDEVDRIRQIVHDENIQYVAIDSVGFAAGGDPSKAEIALQFTNAFRRLGVGGLLIAHQSKGENADKYPFGSIFWYNAARRIYLAKRAEAGMDESTVSVALFNNKTNLSKKGAPIGLQFAFSDAGVTVTRQDIAAMGDDLASRLTINQRLHSVLIHGACTRQQIAEQLDGVKADTLAKTLNRGLSSGKLIEFPDNGRTLIGLRLEAR